MDFLTLTARDGATVRICHQGAHVCSWIPAQGTEQLFLSKRTEFREGVAIRGGVPVIFPQFAGLGTLPKHGFARTAPWSLVQQGHTDDGAAQAVFRLKENIARLTIWPYVFTAELAVSVRCRSVTLVTPISISPLHYTRIWRSTMCIKPAYVACKARIIATASQAQIAVMKVPNCFRSRMKPTVFTPTCRTSYAFNKRINISISTQPALPMR